MAIGLPEGGLSVSRRHGSYTYALRMLAEDFSDLQVFRFCAGDRALSFAFGTGRGATVCVVTRTPMSCCTEAVRDREPAPCAAGPQTFRPGIDNTCAPGVAPGALF